MYVYCITTALVIFLGFFYVYAKRKLSYWSKRGVKSPPAHLIFGNFRDCLFFKKTPGDLLKEIYKCCDSDDPYVGFYVFHKPALLLRDRSLIKQIMITDFEVFPNRRFGWYNERDATYMDSILSIHQPRWKFLRRKLTPFVTGQKLKNMMSLMLKSSQEMLNFIDNLPADKAGQQQTYEARDLASRYTANLLGSTMFGIDTNTFNDDDNGFLISGQVIFRTFVAGVLFIVMFFIPRVNCLFKPICEKTATHFRQVFKESLKLREETESNRGDLMDSLLLLKHGEQNPLYEFDYEHLLAQPSSLFQAGFEAGSTTIALALYHLACHPEHQATLFDEIQTHLTGKEWTIDQLNEMSFTESILIETLRLFAPLPFTDRVAERDYEVPGTDLIIEKGTAIYMSINSVGQDPRYFSDPLKFDPMRKPEDKKFHDSIAFGVGPRACLGPRMGILFAKIALCAIIANYTLRYDTSKPDFTDKKKTHHIFSYPVEGLHLLFEKRDKTVT